MAGTRKQTYEDWRRETVTVANLFLDQENIRLDIDHATALSQEALISDLFTNENALQILVSIAENGFFPDERIVIINENQRSVVIEGNRRVAALKVLAMPEILPTKEAKVKEMLKTAQAIPEYVEVVVAPDREAVQHFLASKHTQIRRRAWPTMRQAYFYKAQLERGKTVEDLRSEYPSANIVKFLRLINMQKIARAISYGSEEIERKVHSDRSFPASTVERLYESPQARTFLGFEFDEDGEVIIGINKMEFEKGIKKIIQDSVTGSTNTRKLGNAKQIKKYLDDFTAAETPNIKKSGKVKTSKDFAENSPPPPRKRVGLAPSMEFNLESPGVERMLHELQRIDYSKLPNATHDLLRSFLECSLKEYFDQKGIKVPAKKTGGYKYLKDVLQTFVDEMKADGNKKLEQIAQQIKSNNGLQMYTIEYLDALNHNPSLFSTEYDVKAAWDKMEPLIRHVLKCQKRP